MNNNITSGNQARKPSGFVAAVVRGLRNIAFGLKEKPKSQVDEFELEHLLVYHGLVGSQAENQRKYKDVRVDIIEAVNRKNSRDLCVALKLPPLWWEDKLQTIFTEVSQKDGAAAIETLLAEVPPEDYATSDPLRHEDWQVRANAALILAVLKVNQAADRMAESLADAAGSVSGIASPGFCHIAFALGRLSGEKAQATLLPFLESDNNWICVDAARALAQSPSDSVIHALMQSMLARHQFSDYMAVAIARQMSIPELVRGSVDPVVQDGCLEVIVGVAEASLGTFNKEIVLDTNIDVLLAEILARCQIKPTARGLRALSKLVSWAEENNDLLHRDRLREAASARQYLQAGTFRQQILKSLSESTASGSSPEAITSDYRDLIKLAGELNLLESAPYFLAYLKSVKSDASLSAPSTQSLYLDDVLAAIACLEPSPSETSTEMALSLEELLSKTVNIDERLNLPLSAQPVAEEDIESNRRYWLILKALGRVPAEKSLSLLLKSAGDFASDKRQQALDSLLSSWRLLLATGEKANSRDANAADVNSVSAKLADANLANANSGQSNSANRNPQLQSLLVETHNLIEKSLQDPAVSVRQVAIEGVAQLDLIDLLPVVLKLCQAKQISIKKQSRQTINILAIKHKATVEAAVRAQLNRNTGIYDRQNWESILSDIT